MFLSCTSIQYPILYNQHFKGNRSHRNTLRTSLLNTNLYNLLIQTCVKYVFHTHKTSCLWCILCAITLQNQHTIIFRRCISPVPWRGCPDRALSPPGRSCPCRPIPAQYRPPALLIQRGMYLVIPAITNGRRGLKIALVRSDQPSVYIK